MNSPLLYAQENTVDGDELEIIAVKSELRVKRVQDIPNSMTTLSADKMDAKAVTRMDDLQFASPGLSIFKLSSPTQYLSRPVKQNEASLKSFIHCPFELFRQYKAY
jgi:outer membrane receptor for ferric coprogen and ferric-rhodotorulic acid